MSSIRSLANCIGVSGDFTILGDFFGFWRRRLPPDPTGARVTVSLLSQARLLKGEHIHVNVVAVGSDSFTDAEDQQIDYSLYRIRNIYAAVGVGVGRARHYGVTAADAQGLDNVTTEAEMEEIAQTWRVDNDGIDVFIPFAMNVPSGPGVLLGLSPVPGPCEAKDDKGMNGSMVGLFGQEQTSRSFSHEVGHYLGLGHQNASPKNLLCQSSSASSIRDSVELRKSQGDDMKDHCLCKDNC
jgi:hypothetical protein